MQLIPGAAGVAEADALLSPLRLSLVIAWTAMAVAAVAVGCAAGRRDRPGRTATAFVSAVTHELRTPLTTFRMYTEMLSEGMVSDDDRRQAYLRDAAASRLSG